jgi:hypothetical protein
MSSSGGTFPSGGTSWASVSEPGGGEQGDLVAAVGQPVGQQRHHPLDAAVAAGRNAIPGRSDDGDAHGTSFSHGAVPDATTRRDGKPSAVIRLARYGDQAATPFRLA